MQFIMAKKLKCKFIYNMTVDVNVSEKHVLSLLLQKNNCLTKKFGEKKMPHFS